MDDTDDAPKTVTVVLDTPVEHKGTTYSELTFRRRKARDLVAMDAVSGDTNRQLAMLSSMAGVPFPVMLDLDGDDFDRIQQETIVLMGKFLARELRAALAAMAGEAPSP